MEQATLDRHAYILKANPGESSSQMWARAAEFTQRCCYDERGNYVLIKKSGGTYCAGPGGVGMDCDKVIDRRDMKIYDLVRSAGSTAAVAIFEFTGHVATSTADFLEPVPYAGAGQPNPPQPPSGIIEQGEFYRRFGEMNAFYASQAGLQRPGGMVIDRDGVPTCDEEAMGQWGYQLMLGVSVESCKSQIRKIPGGEWQQKHPGVPPF